MDGARGLELFRLSRQLRGKILCMRVRRVIGNAASQAHATPGSRRIKRPGNAQQERTNRQTRNAGQQRRGPSIWIFAWLGAQRARLRPRRWPLACRSPNHTFFPPQPMMTCRAPAPSRNRREPKNTNERGTGGEQCTSQRQACQANRSQCRCVAGAGPLIWIWLRRMGRALTELMTTHPWAMAAPMR